MTVANAPFQPSRSDCSQLAICKRDDLFESAFRYTAVGMAIVGPTGRLERVNPAFAAILGRSEDELIRLNLNDISNLEDRDEDLELRRRLDVGDVDSLHVDRHYRRADGSEFWVGLTVSALRDAEGRPLHYIVQAQDLSARIEAEAAVRASEERYRLIAENTSDIIAVTDLDGVIRYISPSVTSTGWEPSDVLGQSFALAMPKEDAKAVSRHFQALLDGAPSHSMRWRIHHGKTGETLWLESRVSLMRDPRTGEAIGSLDIVRDVTAEVRQTEALLSAHAAAEAAAKAKTEFLANMSHEIRTPLTAVLGFARLLEQAPDLSADASHYAARITGAGRGLLALVNDILDFSKIEAGRYELRPAPTSIRAVCEDSLALFAVQAAAKSLLLRLELAEEIPEAVLIDGNRLRQMLVNLLGNAVKFTEAGDICLSARWTTLDGLTVEVIDTGPGLEAEAQIAVFERFRQADSSTSRLHSGSGLGLAITRGIADAMGGDITVSSALGEGTTFRLCLPAPACPSPGIVGAADSTLSIEGVRVLVVDDNAANRELASRLLAAMGAEVFLAADGREALAALDEQPVDVVLMDLRMPGLDGHEALSILRAGGGPNARIPVLAFTAEADVAATKDVERFDGLVRKPIEPLPMLTTIANVLGPEQEAPSHAFAIG